MVANPGVVGTGVIRLYSEALADLVDTGPLGAPVPTCGGWTLADLAWHLGEVQDFWGFVIAERPNPPDLYVQPERPDDPFLAQFLRDGCGDLVMSLGNTAGDLPAWSWSDDHTVGFTLRRQSHEALIHYVDGALAVGAPVLGIDPGLAADGVDEMVNVMFAPVADDSTFEPEAVVALRATDTDDSWRVVLGTATGSSGERAPHVVRSAGERAELAIAGPATVLNLWLWGRGGASGLDVTGPAEPGVVLPQFRAAIAAATQ